MQFRFSVLVLFALILGVNLVGCGTIDPMQTTGVAENKVDAVTQLVSDRAQQRWNALLEQNMDVAYQFISPAGRSLMSLKDYRPRVNAGFWRGARGKEAICAAETCELTVLVDMLVENVKFTNPIKETWILDAGKWWFVYQG